MRFNVTRSVNLLISFFIGVTAAILFKWYSEKFLVKLAISSFQYDELYTTWLSSHAGVNASNTFANLVSF